MPPPPNPVHRLEDRLEFETLISDTSAALLKAPPEQLDSAVESALKQVREFFQADRCALLSVSADQQVVNVRLASWGEGISPVSPDLNLAPMFTWAAQKLLKEQVPVRISRVADLPSESEADRPGWESIGFRSAMALPIETGPVVGHLIVIQTVHLERDWPDALVQRLRVLGELLAGALERRALIAGLREVEARLSSGAELAGLAYYEVDYGRGVAWADDRFYQLCGIPLERRGGLQAMEQWAANLHPEDRPRVEEGRLRLQDGTLSRLSSEYRYLHPALGSRWLQHLAVVSRRDAAGRAAVAHGVLRDVTERRQAEEESMDLSRRRLRADEEQRAQLARELHDDVTQRLAVLAIDAGRAEMTSGGGALAAQLRAIREGLSRLSEDVHSLAYQLHPAVLEELGLVEALRTACERFGIRQEVALSVDLAPLPAGLGKDGALCLFRVAQEALSNVARHARARTVSVTVREVDRGVLLAVRDDGVGFDPAHPETRGSLGLASMGERTRLVGGTLELDSAPEKGTAVVAWVPAGGGPR